MKLTDTLKEEILKAMEETEEFFLAFVRKDENDNSKIESKLISQIKEENLFKIIIELLIEEDRFSRFAEYTQQIAMQHFVKKEDIENPENENCGVLTREEVDALYSAMLEKENGRGSEENIE